MGHNYEHNGIAVFDHKDESGTSAHVVWMDGLHDGRSIASLSLPGTNRSASKSSCTARNRFQAWDIPKQLRNGVRFLDIRCEWVGSVLRLCDNDPRDVTTENVIESCVDFLHQHQTEFIVMVIRISITYDQDHLAVGTYLNQLFQPAERFCTNSHIPTVGDARGKVVIMNDTRGTGIFMGIPSGSWPQNGRVPSVYDDSNAAYFKSKWPRIEMHLQLASSEEGNSQAIHITYTSGSSHSYLPVTVADRINGRLDKLLRGSPGQRAWGYVVMDYPGLALINYIIDSNFNGPDEMANA